MSFAHQSGAGGVTVHGLLTGLDVDDHLQYALLAGRAGGQTVIGGLAASENLTLQSTAHATRGRVRVQDYLQLLTNRIYDSGNNRRILLATTSPHIALYGDLDVSGKAEIGPYPYTTGYVLVNAGGWSALGEAYAFYGHMTGVAATGSQITVGLLGNAWGSGTPTLAYTYGLYFWVIHDSPATTEMGAIITRLESGDSGSGPITIARGVYLPDAAWAGSKPITLVAFDVGDQGIGAGGTAYGLRIADQTATTVRLLELGPVTPYLRLVGGAPPAANCTHLWLAEGVIPTQRNVQWKLYSTLVAGDRVAVFV